MLSLLRTKAEDVMTSKVKIVKEDAPVNVVANIMVRNNVNRVPVLDNDGNLVRELY